MDPLKPFGALVRSIRSKAADRLEVRDRTGSGAAAGTNKLHAPSAAAPVQPLRARLRHRIVTLPSWNSDRAREIFIETVLMSELGEDLARDPEFGEVVRNISRHLSTDAAISRRLDQLLTELRGDATSS